MSGILSAFIGRVAGVVTDAYFNLVTLLLPGNGTNGAQNNTFLDSSTNNFTITRNGNTTQGTFSPFSQTGWSNFFDGTGDYLSLTIGSTTIGSGDFTIEFWYYPTAFQNFDTMFSTTRGANGFNIGTNASASVVWYSSSAEQINSGTLTQNAWNHIAFTRTSNTLRLYLNGSQTGATPTVSTNFSATSCWIGDLATSGGEPSQGYISNLRIVTQSLASGSTYTVSTTPLTAIANTSLLTCQSNRFIDNSSNAFAITRNGDVSVQAFSPFAPTAAYSAATVGGSGYFDGTGDYLQIAANSAFQFDADFTVECWFYSGTSTTANKYDQIIGTIESANAGYWRLGSEFNGGKQFWFTWTTGSYNDILTSFSVSDNAWHHLAVSRISNSVRLFVDGVQRGSTTTVTTNLNANAPLMIMNSTQGNNQTQGYVSSARIIKGQGLYNGTFTPPTAPFTTSSVGSTGSGAASSITGTVSILTNFTNAAITDATAKNDLETVGNAQISTTQSKFGGSSMYFDGTGDYLYTNGQLPSSIGTANFTIEFWVYLSSINRINGLIGDMTELGTTGFSIYVQANNTIRFQHGSSLITSTNTMAASTWYYVAVTRSGTSLNLYVDGTSWLSGTVSTNLSSSSLVIGRAYTDTNNYYLNGYIDDLRITLGQARTVTTSPTSAFPLQ